jgi:probable rRNA maturation factor
VSVRVEVVNRSGWRIDEPAAIAVLLATLGAEGVADGEVGLALVEAEEMAELNGQYRGRPTATDVLSFPVDMLEELPSQLPRQLGDLVICPVVADRQGTPIATLLVHGALHLVGYDHESDGGRMLRRQAALLEEVQAVAASAA